MRIYWFWPWVHGEELEVPAAVPRAGDELVLHAMRGRVEPLRSERFRVEPTLAPVDRAREGSFAWALGRARTYLTRSAQRRRALREGNFDVCHVVFLNYFTDWLDLRLIARRTKLVFEVHDVTPHQSRLAASLERFVLKLEYASPGVIVARHEYVKALLVDRFAIDPDRVTVVPLVVRDVGAATRTDYHDIPTVLFFGTLRRNKGVDVLLSAISQLDGRRDIRFVFAGRGFADVERAVRDAARADPRIVVEHGYIEQQRKHALFESSDVVVLPYTEFTSMSGVLGDAYSYRLPVVASDVGALGGTVRADGTGWVVAPGDPAELAGAIDRALRRRDEWAAAAACASAAASERTADRIAARIRALYDGPE
jgi:glycosyltransferase involved in cell wall biosynthesis